MISEFQPSGPWGGVNTLGYRKSHILTSRTYEGVQRTVDVAIGDVVKNVVRLYDREGGFMAQFDAKIGFGTYGQGRQPYL